MIAIRPGEIPDAFRAEALLIKAQLYAEQMEGFESDDWRHALWSGLLLEHLSRAALANVNPVLLADTTERSWSHIYFALGFSPLDPKYAPRSIAINEVVRRLGDIFPNFKEMANFVITHTGRRNAELHSGEAPFEGVDGANWQPAFYRACQILLIAVGLDLEDLFGAEPSKTARALMTASADDAAKAVLGDIAAHSKVWTTLPEEEREKQRAIADVWATRSDGHRVKCPACSSTALVFGDPCAAPHKTIEGDEITETQEYLPSRFECVACRLRIVGLAQLIAAKLGPRYKRTSTYDAAEFYAPEDEHAGYEDDNNEY